MSREIKNFRNDTPPRRWRGQKKDLLQIAGKALKQVKSIGGGEPLTGLSLTNNG